MFVSVRFVGPCPTPRQGTESPAPAPHPLPAPSLSAASSSLPLPMFVSVRFVGPCPTPRQGTESPAPAPHPLPAPHCPLYLHPFPSHVRPRSSLFVFICPFPLHVHPSFSPFPPVRFVAPAPAPHPLPGPSLPVVSPSLPLLMFVSVRFVGPCPTPGRGLSPCTRASPASCPLIARCVFIPPPSFSPFLVRLCSYLSPLSPSVRLCSPHASPLLPSASPRGRSRKGFGASESPSQRLPVRVCRSRKPCARSWAASSRLS